MAKYVGFKIGKVHEKHQMSEYYCGGCGYPLTDHDSFCPECGGALRQCDADQPTEPISVEIYPFTEYGERLNKALRPWEEAAKIYKTYKEFDEIQQRIRKTSYASRLQKELHEKRNDLDHALCLCIQACNDLAESCGIDLGIEFKKYDKE